MGIHMVTELPDRRSAQTVVQALEAYKVRLRDSLARTKHRLAMFAVRYGVGTTRFLHEMTAEDLSGGALEYAEALGFDVVWFADHIVIPRQVPSVYPYAADGASPFDPDQPFDEPLSVLNFLAGGTQHIRLGTHVLIIPYRPPVFTANTLATLDVLSGGRLILGAGVGWMEEEFQALGLSTFAERRAVTNECLRLFQELRTQEQPQFQGKYVQVSGVGFQPKPLQKPHPPIWIGGDSEPALRRAATLGDGWMTIGLRPQPLLGPGAIEGKIARLRALTRQAGRSEAEVTISFTAPVEFTRTSARHRFLLQGHPDEIAADLRQYPASWTQIFI
jgi:probable F420-dependent oxidoreductase